MSFVPKSYKPGNVARPVARATTTTLPDIIELTPTATKPSVLLQGESGTGKTHAIGSLMAAGYNVLVIAIEPKVQAIQKYKPLTLFMSAVMPDGSKPTHTDIYNRLIQFKDNLGKGEYRTVNGKQIDVIAFDGFLELGTVMHRHFKNRGALSASTGMKNSFLLWEQVAENACDYFNACRDASGLASTQDGIEPVGIVATIGEQVVTNAFGATRYEPMFPGKIAPSKLPYSFEVVLRLTARKGEDGHEFVACTTKTEEFNAKAPFGLFEPEEINPNFGEMYKKLIAHFADTTDKKE